MFFFSSRRRHTRCALVTGVQTCALPICRRLGVPLPSALPYARRDDARRQRLSAGRSGMTRTALFLAGTAVLSFASPAAAQSMDPTSMPGMTLPVAPKKTVAETVQVPHSQSQPPHTPEMDHRHIHAIERN